MDTIIQLGVVMLAALGLSIPFGLYIAMMISFEMRPLERTLAKFERLPVKIMFQELQPKKEKVSMTCGIQDAK